MAAGCPALTLLRLPPVGYNGPPPEGRTPSSYRPLSVVRPKPTGNCPACGGTYDGESYACPYCGRVAGVALAQRRPTPPPPPPKGRTPNVRTEAVQARIVVDPPAPKPRDDSPGLFSYLLLGSLLGGLFCGDD
jgi:hypothetical protein